MNKIHYQLLVDELLSTLNNVLKNFFDTFPLLNFSLRF